jgi:hypothetical protein
MALTIERLEVERRQAEATPEYSFVFIRRDRERRLLTLTPQDPLSTTAPTFNLFRSTFAELIFPINVQKRESMTIQKYVIKTKTQATEGPQNRRQP